MHPLHVESVAWVTERKDVLSTSFGILTLWAYSHYAKRPAVARYFLVFVAFALSLMAKPMLVTLPFVLLLLDYWPLRRLQSSTTAETLPVSAKQLEEPSVSRPPSSFGWLVVEKLPLFLLSAACSVMTVLAQGQGGAVVPLDEVSLSSRVLNALVAYVRYLQKAIWPSNLVIFYPPLERLSVWQGVGAGLLLLAISAI